MCRKFLVARCRDPEGVCKCAKLITRGRRCTTSMRKEVCELWGVYYELVGTGTRDRSIGACRRKDVAWCYTEYIRTVTSGLEL